MTDTRSKRITLYITYLAALLAVALIVGCGGDDDGESGGGSGDGSVAQGQGSEGKGQSRSNGSGGSGAGTKAVFAKEVNGICKKVRDRLRKESREHLDSGEEAEDFNSLVSQIVIPRIEQEIEEIQALETPADAEAAVGALVSGFQSMIQQAEAEPRQFITGGKAIIATERIAQSRGFASCGPLV